NWVECTKCGCQTPETFEEVAISAWNRRTPPAVPEGWVMVPKEPTPEMLDAATPPESDWIGHKWAKPGSFERWRQGHREEAERKYRSMISAAPAAPTDERLTNSWRIGGNDEHSRETAAVPLLRG